MTAILSWPKKVSLLAIGKKEKSLLAELLSLELEISALLNGLWFSVKNILSLLAGKLSLEKKICAFEWCLVSSQKYTKSFGGKNLAPCNRFVPSKLKVYVWFLARLGSKVQNVFFLLATLHSQNTVKEIAYISSSYQAPFQKRHISLFVW